MTVQAHGPVPQSFGCEFQDVIRQDPRRHEAWPTMLVERQPPRQLNDDDGRSKKRNA